MLLRYPWTIVLITLGVSFLFLQVKNLVCFHCHSLMFVV